jgi:hypothetical protein
MTIQYSVAVNNARLDSIETTVGTAPKLRIFKGTKPANCAAADAGTLLCQITLPSDWMNAASAASKTLLGTWQGTASAGAADTPTHYRITDSAGTTVHEQGDCGIGSGDLQVNGTISNGQTVQVTAYTKNAGNQ